VGDELDAQCAWAINRQMQLGAGVGHIFPHHGTGIGDGGDALGGLGLRDGPGELSEPEIEDLDAARMGGLGPGDQDVIGLQIAVRETGQVRRRHAVRNLHG